MSMFEPGSILRYDYLWARQADAGEESGRKARLVCLVVRTASQPTSLFLFPLTSQRPDQSCAHIPVSEIECRRGGLEFPCWLILDEFNRMKTDDAYDLANTRPIGLFSQAFLRKIAVMIKKVAARQRIRAIVRS